MAVSLSKGGNVNLSKETPNLNKLVVGLGWDARATDGAAFDLDSNAFWSKQMEKCAMIAIFVFTTIKLSRAALSFIPVTIPQARAMATTKPLK